MLFLYEVRTRQGMFETLRAIFGLYETNYVLPNFKTKRVVDSKSGQN